MIMTSTDQFVDPSIQPFLSFHSHLITRMYRYSMMTQELIHNAMMMIVLVNIEFRWGSCWNRARRHGVIHYTTWLGLVSIRWIWDHLLAFLLVKLFRFDDSHKKRNEITPNPFTWTPLLNYFVTALNIPQQDGRQVVRLKIEASPTINSFSYCWIKGIERKGNELLPGFGSGGRRIPLVPRFALSLRVIVIANV